VLLVNAKRDLISINYRFESTRFRWVLGTPHNRQTVSNTTKKIHQKAEFDKRRVYSFELTDHQTLSSAESYGTHFSVRLMTKPNEAMIYALTHEFFPKKGGIATFTEEMARAAAESGRQVEVWAPMADDVITKDFPFSIRRLKLKGSQDISCQLRLAKEMIRERRKLRQGIVYLCDPGPILTMCNLHFFKALKPAKLIITLHGSEVLKFAANPGRKLIVSKLIKAADRVSAPSKYTHNLITQHFPVAKRKTFLTPGALRSDFIETEQIDLKPNKRVRILTVGRLHPRKGQAHIIEAISRLPRHLRRQTSFWIVGTGKKYGYETQLREMAEAADFRVRFFGDVSNEKLEELYAQADIFSMTSVHFRKSVEGFGLVYLEAAAHGLPIVAHRVGGVAEAVSHEHNGLLVNPDDQQGLTQAFARLIENRNLRQEMGKNGIEWAKRNSWRQSADLLFNRWDVKIDPSLEANALEPVGA